MAWLPACALAIACAGAWAYAPGFAGVFILDDLDSIAGNPTIRSLTPLTRVLSPPPSLTVSGRPIANLTFAFNYALAPADVHEDFDPTAPGAPSDATARVAANAWGYHAANLAIHLLAALALFGIVWRTLETEKLRRWLRGTDAPDAPVALAVALIWVVHPLHTESVTYVVQRVESMMGWFYLTTIYCAIRAWKPRRRVAWSVAAVAACALGMATKEVMVTAPVLVWLWDWTFGTTGGAGAEGRIRRWPLYVALASTWIVLAALVAGGPRTATAGFGLEGWTPWTYLLTQAGVVLRYLRLVFVPEPLVFYYHWPRVEALGQVLPQAAAVALLCLAAVYGLVRRHPFGFAAAWTLLILAPTSSVLPIVSEIAAEHRMYLPLAGVVAAVVVGGAGILRRVPGTSVRTRQWVAAGVVLALVLALGAITRARNRDYASAPGLWLDTMAKQPANPYGQMGYGVELLAAGRAAEAEPYLQAAVRLDGRDARALMNLGAAEFVRGKIDQAVPHLEGALALRPDFTGARRNLAEAFAARQEDARATAEFQRLLQDLPDDASATHRLAWILATSTDEKVRDSLRAVGLAERAVELTGRRNAMFLSTLAAAYSGVGRLDEAVGAMREALAAARTSGRAEEAAGLERQLRRLEERQRAARSRR